MTRFEHWSKSIPWYSISMSYVLFICTQLCENLSKLKSCQRSKDKLLDHVTSWMSIKSNKVKTRIAYDIHLCSTIYCNRTWTRGLLWINAYHTTHCRLIDLNLNLQYHTNNKPYTTYFMCFLQLRWTIHDAQSLTLCDPYLIVKGITLV